MQIAMQYKIVSEIVYKAFSATRLILTQSTSNICSLQKVFCWFVLKRKWNSSGFYNAINAYYNQIKSHDMKQSNQTAKKPIQSNKT